MPSKETHPSSIGASFASPFAMFAPAMEFMVDAAQRSVLFWDVMRQRGNQYREHIAETAPHVLDYEVELVMDGRKLERPVNYVLVRVVPPAGVEIDAARRPFVIVDPRAGHGPGIGGFKADSEIGVAFKAGHPCYFIGFLPEPMPGQTIEDIARAEAVFLEKVIALHPEADGKPCVIGNCQAGWAVMMLAAIRPELFGPIIVAGSPLSYWAGVHGKYPMRYSGGLLGGSWLTALTSDLGHGKFDGAWLVQNFENQNPANTLWSKQYNLYSKIDTEAPRYLDSSAGGAATSISMPRRSSSSSTNCSSATSSPPEKSRRRTAPRSTCATSARRSWCSAPRATTSLRRSRRSDWILDLYENVDEIRSYGQTIVYTIHEVGRSSRHLRLRRRRQKAARRIFKQYRSDRCAAARPLRGSVRGQGRGHRQSRTGGRRLGDALRSEDTRRHPRPRRQRRGGRAAVRDRGARFRDQSRALPDVCAAHGSRHGRLSGGGMVAADAPLAAAIRALLQRESDDGHRRRPRRAGSRRSKARGGDNPFVAMQENASRQIVAALDAWRDLSEAMVERTFLAVYGSPTLQAAVGIDPAVDAPVAEGAQKLAAP